jgi:hypothetical protein
MGIGKKIQINNLLEGEITIYKKCKSVKIEKLKIKEKKNKLSKYNI